MPDRNPVPNLTIRPETTADHEAVAAVVAAAFGSPVEAELVSRIRASPEYRPELALVAELDGGEIGGGEIDGGEIVGHTMISGCVIRDEAGIDHPAVMLSPLATRPDHHRRGIGAALVTAALDRAERAGEPLVILEGDPAYYGRFGFVAAYQHDLTIHVPDWAPREAGQVRFLSAYGADEAERLRGTVVYPAAFDGLE